jgi:fructokinase
MGGIGVSQVICLGEVLFDLLARETGKSITEVSGWTPYLGGAPANVATALVKLGTTASFIGCVGTDGAGKEAEQTLESLGVDISGLQHHPTAPTRKVYVLRSENGDRSFAGFGDYPIDGFADAYLQASSLRENLFVKAEYLAIGTLELAYPDSRAAVWRALELAEAHQLKIVVDANWRSMFWQDPKTAAPIIQQLWQRADYLKLSVEEALLFFQTDDAKTICDRLLEAEGVFVTDGSKEISYCLAGFDGKIMPPPVAAIDTTGAGDAFMAGIIDRLIEYPPNKISSQDVVENIVNYASAVGALTATKMGAIDSQPNAAEVEAFLAKRKGSEL